MKYEESAAKADLIAAARKTASVYVTKESPGADDKPERILMDAGERTAKQMLDDYKIKMANYATIPLDIEGMAMRIFKSEWTILSGYTGTGKTTYLRQMVCGFLKDGKNVFVAPLESSPEDYLIDLAGTAAGVEIPNEAQLQCFLDTYGPQLKIWGLVGVADPRKILATVRELCAAGLDIAVIDNLMMLDIAADDIEQQRKFSALLAATVNAKGVHIILVAHPRKPLAADQDPSPSDIAGSSNIGNLAHNVMFIRRGPQGPPGVQVTPMQLWILKRRSRIPGGFMGHIEGYYYGEQSQFHLDSVQQMPTFYLPASFYASSGLTEDIPEHIMNRDAFKVDREEIAAPWDAF